MIEHIDTTYLRKISTLKYPDVYNMYGMTEEARNNLLKSHRKEITLTDIIDILSEKPRHITNSHSFTMKKIIDLLLKVEFNFKLNDEIIMKLYDITKAYMTVGDFKKFIESICDDKEVFTSGELKWNVKIEDLLNCRSYKIYKITQDECIV
jgi:hypothetical protein